MRSWLDISAVLGVSLVVHGAAFAWLGDGVSQGANGAGAGGTASITLAAISPAYTALAEAWTEPPDLSETLSVDPPTVTSQTARAPRTEAAAPTTPAGPATPFLPAIETAIAEPLAIAPRVAEATEMASPPIQLQPQELPPETGDLRPALQAPPGLSSPVFGSRPDAPTGTTRAVAISPRPTSRPAAEPEPANTDLRPAQTAAGNAGAGSQGSSTAPAASAPGAADAALMAQWGGQIAARIAAGVPRIDRTGQVMLQITVGRNGRLQSVAILSSSGDPNLDNTAVSVVQRAGRFPRAPAELPGDSFRFNVPLHFT